MITITGVPFYDGVIEGILFVPLKIGELVGPNLYDIGFWFGFIVFVVITLRLLCGWD
mgnify:CR=1 FL=1